MSTFSPLRADPTRTITLRRQYVAEVSRRFSALSRAVGDLVDREDAFGLRRTTDPFFSINNRWRFETNEQKYRAFQRWLKQQVDEGILEVEGSTSRPWTATYVYSAYRKGVERSQAEVKKKRGETWDLLTRLLEGSAFTNQVSVERLRLLYMRSFEELQGVTAKMSSQMSRVLADGLAQGRNPREIARQLQKQVGLAKNQARTIARTEIIHSYAEGQLDALEALGEEEVTAMVEWSTAGDHRVCPRCSSLEGVVLTIKEARGLIPRHPNCRCAWLPADVGEKDEGQIRQRRQIQLAIERSLKAEFPKASKQERHARTTWIGADKRIAKRRG